MPISKKVAVHKKDSKSDKADFDAEEPDESDEDKDTPGLKREENVAMDVDDYPEEQQNDEHREEYENSASDVLPSASQLEQMEDRIKIVKICAEITSFSTSEHNDVEDKDSQKVDCTTSTGPQKNVWNDASHSKNIKKAIAKGKRALRTGKLHFWCKECKTYTLPDNQREETTEFLNKVKQNAAKSEKAKGFKKTKSVKNICTARRSGQLQFRCKKCKAYTLQINKSKRILSTKSNWLKKAMRIMQIN